MHTTIKLSRKFATDAGALIHALAGAGLCHDGGSTVYAHNYREKLTQVPEP